jgi:MYXO-CTERM domain-containing protein
MATRALAALATAVILSTASTSWGQDAPGPADSDDATGPDAAFGDDGAVDQDTAPDDVEDGGADDSGGAIDPGILDDAAFPNVPGVPSVPALPNNPSPSSYPAGVPTAPTSAPNPGGATDQTVPQATDDEPTTVDDGSSPEAGPQVSASWGDAAPAAEQIAGQVRPDDGCGGCSTGDSGKSGPLVFVLAAFVAAWSCRRRGR